MDGTKLLELTMDAAGCEPATIAAVNECLTSARESSRYASLHPDAAAYLAAFRGQTKELASTIPTLLLAMFEGLPNDDFQLAGELAQGALDSVCEPDCCGRADIAADYVRAVRRGFCLSAGDDDDHMYADITLIIGCGLLGGAAIMNNVPLINTVREFLSAFMAASAGYNASVAQ